MRCAEVVPQHDRTEPPRHLGDQQRVTERLRHLQALDGHPPVVQPVARERVAARVRLRHLVLVVRERQLDAAPVDVERLAEVAQCHRRALQVPAGTAGPPRRVPRRLVGAGLGRLPEGEVVRVLLVRDAGHVVGRVGPRVVDPPPGQRPVLGVGPHAEVDVAARRVGVPALHEPLDHRDHLGDVPGRTRLDGRVGAAQRPVRVLERVLVALRDAPRLHALFQGAVDDLVVDVGDVPAERDLVAAVLEPAARDVEGDAGPDVADVRGSLHGRAAEVDRRFAWRDGYELARGTRGGVIQAQGHPPRIPGPGEWGVHHSSPVAGYPRTLRLAHDLQLPLVNCLVYPIVSAFGKMQGVKNTSTWDDRG